MGISVDVEYRLHASCSECDASVSESSYIYCSKCFEGKALISERIQAALVLLPKIACIACKGKFYSALTVEKIEGFMCLGCAMDCESDLLSVVSKGAR